MQYKFVTVSALAAGAFAQTLDPASQSELLSVASVLQTALPSSLVQEYLTNSAAVSSELASEFSAGEYPSWFTALPSNVQTYLVPSQAAANPTGPVSGAPINSANSTGTLSRTSRTPSVTSTDSPSESSSGSGGAQSSGSSTSEGGAPLPTAVGMGLAGVVGLIGVLAL